MPSSLDKLSVAELKAQLKALHMSQAGDKGTLIHRIRVKQRFQAIGYTSDGIVYYYHIYIHIDTFMCIYCNIIRYGGCR